MNEQQLPNTVLGYLRRLNAKRLSDSQLLRLFADQGALSGDARCECTDPM